MSINIIGISALYHNSACCHIQDGILKTAVEEERFTRIKNDSRIPRNAFAYVLESSGLSINDIDCIAYYEDPVKKLERQLWSGLDIEDKELNYRMNPKRPLMEIRKLFGYDGPIEILKHHLSHAASSYYFSGFDEAAIMTIDGVGEWSTTTYSYGNGNELKLLDEVGFPDSIGLFYAAVTSYLGFKVNSGEYKVMGLAPYGEPIYADKMYELIKPKEDGQVELILKYYDFIKGKRMYSDAFIELFGQPARMPESEITQFHKDVASSLQYVLEEIILKNVKYLYGKCHTDNLCLSGGVALNCAANGRILKDGPFKNIFVQPASDDSGCAIGAAAIVYTRLTGKRVKKMEDAYLGPKYSSKDVKKILDAMPLKYCDYQGNKDQLISDSVKLISDGFVVGWFQGRMEFGPRALGSRSILADPRNEQMRDKINSMVKKREGFRPFAPAVLANKAEEHFDMRSPSPYMLFTFNVKSKLSLPAITHINGTARVQTVDEKTNPFFYKLLNEFDKATGCPIILNTSFNVRGEPIVMTPLDAIRCFINSNIDCLIIEDFIIKRSENNIALLKTIINIFENSIKDIRKEETSVYTFI